MLGLPLLFRWYDQSKIMVSYESNLKVIVGEKWAMRNRVYINDQFSLISAFDSTGGSFYDSIQEGDVVIKQAYDSVYLLVRNTDTSYYKMTPDK